jgi:CubicO group peptidase (beta-lactamase class C family)
VFLFLAAPIRAADPDPAAIDRLAADTLRVWDAPGAAVVVVRGEQVPVLKGYGRMRFDRPDPITPDTPFPLASCTKAFTSAVIATLVDEGEMRWDDPVRRHLPPFHLSDPNADALVSVRDLLTHRTGVGQHDLLWYRAPWGLDEAVERAGRLPLDYPFRGGYAYSSLMYIAAGRAAEKRAGRPWQELVRTRLTGPLGMKGVRFTTKDVTADTRPSGHRRGKEGKIEAMPWYEFPDPNPAGSMVATPRDLALWLRFHLAGGKTLDDRRLVSERNLLETRSPQNVIRVEGNARRMNPDTVQMCYGMGWVIYDHRGKHVVAHGGIIDGFRLVFALVPEEKLGFAVIANLHETRLPQALINILIDRYCGLPERDWNGLFLKFQADDEAAAKSAVEARNKARDPNLKPTLVPDGYVGSYHHVAYGTAKVSADGGKLVLEWSTFRCPLEHFEGDVFRVTEGFFEDRPVAFAARPRQPASAVQFAGVVFERK